jgi:hypothetical protein
MVRIKLAFLSKGVGNLYKQCFLLLGVYEQNGSRC